jgi:hypothetical protein
MARSGCSYDFDTPFDFSRFCPVTTMHIMYQQFIISCDYVSVTGSLGKSTTRQELVWISKQRHLSHDDRRCNTKRQRIHAHHRILSINQLSRIHHLDATMASRVLRPVFRTATRAPAVARSFQTSAALRQDAVVAPVRKPVGAFRGG